MKETERSGVFQNFLYYCFIKVDLARLRTGINLEHSSFPPNFVLDDFHKMTEKVIDDKYIRGLMAEVPIQVLRRYTSSNSLRENFKEFANQIHHGGVISRFKYGTQGHICIETKEEVTRYRLSGFETFLESIDENTDLVLIYHSLDQKEFNNMIWSWGKTMQFLHITMFRGE